MRNWIINHIRLVMELVMAIMLVMSIAAWSVNSEERRQAEAKYKEVSMQLAHAQIAMPLVPDTIHDTVTVTTMPVISVERSTYKKDIADKQLLKDIDVKAQQVESEQTLVVSTGDEVHVHPPDDSVYEYRDYWTHIRLQMATGKLQYQVRDSLTTFVIRQYKHRFLWWRWGTKGYHVKILNFNPHSTLLHESYVRVE